MNAVEHLQQHLPSAFEKLSAGGPAGLSTDEAEAVHAALTALIQFPDDVQAALDGRIWNIADAGSPVVNN